MLPIIFAFLCVFAAANSTTTAHVCTGKSRSLNSAECAAYQDLFDATNGNGWKYCSDSRLDPCSCHGDEYHQITCATSGRSTTITEMVFDTNNLTGTIPSSLNEMRGLVELNLVQNNLRGTIPSSLVSMTGLVYLSISENKLTGKVPPLPFAQYTTGCVIDVPAARHFNRSIGCNEPNCNHFTCPLPTESVKCQMPDQSAGVHCK
jgi:hypothetical protein